MCAYFIKKFIRSSWDFGNFCIFLQGRFYSHRMYYNCNVVFFTSCQIERYNEYQYFLDTTIQFIKHANWQFIPDIIHHFLDGSNRPTNILLWSVRELTVLLTCRYLLTFLFNTEPIFTDKKSLPSLNTTQYFNTGYYLTNRNYFLDSRYSPMEIQALGRPTNHPFAVSESNYWLFSWDMIA